LNKHFKLCSKFSKFHTIFCIFTASCSENGNTYRQVPGTHCQKFTQETATLPPQVHSCSYGLKFDL